MCHLAAATQMAPTQTEIRCKGFCRLYVIKYKIVPHIFIFIVPYKLIHLHLMNDIQCFTHV